MRAVLASLAVLTLVACDDGAGDGWDADAGDGGDVDVADGENDGLDVEGSGDVPADVADGTDGDPDGGEDADAGPRGFIGSPCASDDDCDYAGGVCLTEAPEGMCSLECDLYCPDRAGHPTTFCVDGASLPDEAPGFVEGACFSRCDWTIHPDTGCRAGYGCVSRPRANEPDTLQLVCVPGDGDPLPDCLDDLAALGVSFAAASHTPEHPDGHPELTCVVEDPVRLHSPVHGVDLVSAYTGEPGSIFVACRAAIAVVRTVDDVAPLGVTAIEHMGTYNCRVISGTTELSRHAFADAIDIGAFEFADGTRYTLVDDWEHDTTSPVTAGGSFLYDAAHRWFDARIWNIILTPNYNLAHDNHFHVDLTPGGRFIRSLVTTDDDGRYIGPAPYDD